VIFLSSQFVEPDTLILESDKALYNAKKQGKNRFVIEEYKS
jgi:PleD family two-component response regulator